MTNLHDNFTLEVPHVTLSCNLCRMKRDVTYVIKLHFYMVKLLCHVTYYISYEFLHGTSTQCYGTKLPQVNYMENR